MFKEKSQTLRTLIPLALFAVLMFYLLTSDLSKIGPF